MTSMGFEPRMYQLRNRSSTAGPQQMTQQRGFKLLQQAKCYEDLHNTSIDGSFSRDRKVSLNTQMSNLIVIYIAGEKNNGTTKF